LPRVRETGAARGAAQFAGVLLHGRGKTPEEKIDLAARFGNIPGIRWLVPVAETPGSWYPGRFWDPRQSNEPFLTEAVERCHEAVEEASEGGRLGAQQIVIVGFSQGACLAIEYALRHPGRVGSLIVFTGAVMAKGFEDTSFYTHTALLSLNEGVIPPTINYTTPDPECDLDYTPREARKKEMRIAISNSFAFGGNNVCLVFGKA
jgi:predicted esterase